ncbi:MAG: segregation/condensation protein A, partial [Sandaracinaceae bacterium]|nr:segregation/condensation protein A [Sandaracinaceae bacterium]
MAERTPRRARSKALDASVESGEGALAEGATSEATRAPDAKANDAKDAKDKAPQIEALDPNFQLRLPSFEGPLDLLLHLIQKHELDILDLPIAFVVERYLEYLTVMETLDLDVASEYLVMAATLAHIKSKMLLPPDPSQVDEEAENVEEIDPRAELIRRLLEYQKYKHAAEQLLTRGVAGRDVFTRGMEAPEAMGPAPLASIGLFKLLDAFQAVLKRANQESAFEITAEGVSIQERMALLTERLRGRRHTTFDELFEDARTVYEVVVTFLAILEMAKRRLTRIYQADVLAPIHLELLVSEVDESMVAGVDEYDGRAAAPQATPDDEGDLAVARPGEDPLGEALDPEPQDPQDAPPAIVDEAAVSDAARDEDEPD